MRILCLAGDCCILYCVLKEATPGHQIYKRIEQTLHNPALDGQRIFANIKMNYDNGDYMFCLQ